MSAGKSLPHDSARGHVTGESVYIDDQPEPRGLLHVAVGGAAIAHGHIKHINVDAVRNAPGVVDVIVASDLPAERDIGPVFPGDPLLVESLVEYLGQPVFAVAATSLQAARRALALAEVEYNPLTPVLTLDDAIDKAFYVRPPISMQRGKAQQALANAPHRLQGEVRMGGQEHFYLEGQVARAIPGEDQTMTVHSSNQNPTEAQHIVARVLGVDMHKVTLDVRRMGGGFGGKETQANMCCALAAVFAVRQGVAVNCRLARRDDMLMTGKRHGFLNRYDVGFDSDGRIVGIVYVLAGQCGNSPDLSDAIVDRAMFHADNAYYLPDVLIEGLRCKTHTVSNTAFRGFGGPQGMLAMEVVIDEIAYALKLDPLVVRQRNFYDTQQRNVTPYHQTLDAFNVPAMVDQLATSARYTERRQAVQSFNKSNDILKRGIAITPVKFGISFTVKHLNQGGALIHLYSDGSVQLNHGGTEMGQGLMAKVRQIVSTTLGIAESRIAVMSTRTDKVPNTSPTAASSGTDINGMAALNAAQALRDRLIGFLVAQHATDSERIQFGEDEVVVLNHGENPIRYTWPELAHAAYMERVSLSATGFYKTPAIHFNRESGKGRPFYYFANGVALTEVVIDTLTGENRVLAVDILHDVGNSINPALDRGQIEGGYIQGLGWLTTEELKWNDDGRLLTDGPATYKIPAIGDAPAHFNVELLSNAPNEEATVLRSKAVGEPPLMLAISAFAALRDAIAACANHDVFPVLNAPATPEEILRVCTELRRTDIRDHRDTA